MKSPFTDYKTLLSTFSYDEQINEINQIINELANYEKQHGNIIDTRYDRIEELEHIKNNIIKWNKLIN